MSFNALSALFFLPTLLYAMCFLDVFSILKERKRTNETNVSFGLIEITRITIIYLICLYQVCLLYSPISTIRKIFVNVKLFKVVEYSSLEKIINIEIAQ